MKIRFDLLAVFTGLLAFIAAIPTANAVDVKYDDGGVLYVSTSPDNSVSVNHDSVDVQSTSPTSTIASDDHVSISLTDYNADLQHTYVTLNSGNLDMVVANPDHPVPGTVPEPGTILLLSSGLIGAIARRRSLQKN